MSVDWDILWHPLFEERFMDLLERVEELAEGDPVGFYNHRDYKFFENVSNCIQNRILPDPGHRAFNLGNTLGKTNKNWRTGFRLDTAFFFGILLRLKKSC